MNFDFLKDKQLDYIYKNCEKAEKQANMYPDSSLVSSRKAAEALAKLIYMRAYSEEMARMTFDDVLKSQELRKFLKSRNLLNAFYNIKQKGNIGAHPQDVDPSSEDAIEILKDLHFVTGEVAKKLGLISNYPRFDNDVKAFVDIETVDEEDLNEQVEKMYAEFVLRYEEEKRNERLEESDTRYAVEGLVDMHEHISFNSKPKHRSTIKLIQEYISFLFRMSKERNKKRESDLYSRVYLDVSIIMNNNDQYSSDENMFEIGINMLELADSFEINIRAKGNFKEYYDVNFEGGTSFVMVDSESIWKGSGIYDELLSCKRREDFIYKQTTIYPDGGVINCKKIENGKDYVLSDLMATSSPDILISHPLDSWFSWNPHIRMTFDRERFSKQFEMIKESARRHLPSYQLEDCEREWLDEEEDFLLDFPQKMDSFQSLQDYLDEINEALYEFDDLDDFDFYMGTSKMGEEYPDVLWVSENNFAVASVEWINDEFKVIGCEF